MLCSGQCGMGGGSRAGLGGRRSIHSFISNVDPISHACKYRIISHFIYIWCFLSNFVTCPMTSFIIMTQPISGQNLFPSVQVICICPNRVIDMVDQVGTK